MSAAQRHVDGVDNTILTQLDKRGYGFVFHLHEIYVFFIGYTDYFCLHLVQCPISFRFGRDVVQPQIAFGILGEFSGSVGMFGGLYGKFDFRFRKYVSYAVILATCDTCRHFCLRYGRNGEQQG